MCFKGTRSPQGNADYFVSSLWKREDSWFHQIHDGLSNLPCLPTTWLQVGVQKWLWKIISPEDRIHVEGNFKVLFLLVTNSLRHSIQTGHSLVVQWLGLGASTAVKTVQSLVGELRSRKPYNEAKKKKNTSLAELSKCSSSKVVSQTSDARV